MAILNFPILRVVYFSILVNRNTLLRNKFTRIFYKIIANFYRCGCCLLLFNESVDPRDVTVVRHSFFAINFNYVLRSLCYD